VASSQTTPHPPLSHLFSLSSSGTLPRTERKILFLLSQIPPPNLEIRLCMSHHRALHRKSFPLSYRTVAGVEYQRRSKKVGLPGHLSSFRWPVAASDSRRSSKRAMLEAKARGSCEHRSSEPRRSSKRAVAATSLGGRDRGAPACACSPPMRRTGEPWRPRSRRPRSRLL